MTPPTTTPKKLEVANCCACSMNELMNKLWDNIKMSYRSVIGRNGLLIPATA